MRQSEAVKHAERGLRTLDDLRALDGEKLSVEARTGLKYYNDLQTKIPRDEVDVWNVAALVLSALVLTADHYSCRRGNG